MSGFVKLDCDILDSSIMLEDSDTFKAFIIFLASCNSDGIADVPAASIVMRCKVSPSRAMEILKILSSPDVLSKSKDEEGRRIIPYGDSGHHWKVVNYKKYRDFNYSNTPEAIRKRRQRGNGEFMVTGETDISLKTDSFLGCGHVTESVTLPGHVTTPLSSVLLSSNSSSDLKINEETKKEECSDSGSSEKPKSKLRYEPKHFTMAEMMQMKIRDSGTDMLLKDSVLPDWANTFRLMMEQDKRTMEQIIGKMEKVFEDPFWSKQIRSAGKFRLRWNEGKLDNVGAKPKSQSSYTQHTQEEPEFDSRVEQERFTEDRALNRLSEAVRRFKTRQGEDPKKWVDFFCYARPADRDNAFLRWIWDMAIKGTPFTEEIFNQIHNRIVKESGLTIDTWEQNRDEVFNRFAATSAQQRT